MVMPSGNDLHYTRETLVQVLRTCGLPELADTAARELPERVDGYEVFAWAARHGVTRDELVSRMGGSP
jgi:hypothetical protein